MSGNQETEMYSRWLEKAQEELKDKDDLIIILKMKLDGLKEKVEELEEQLAKKDEIIKELKIYSDFLSQYSDCDDSCSWARHSLRCRSVTKRILDHKKKIEELENEQ